jgi:integrase
VSNRWNSHDDYNLWLFDAYCQEHFPTTKGLTQEMLDNWCSKRKTEQNNTCNRRNHAVKCFVRYLRERGKTDVLEPIMPRRERRTSIPHAFTNEELQNFFRACDEIPVFNKGISKNDWLLRKITIPVIFRLLYSSGMRTIEVRKLKVADVNFESGVINIQDSKGNDQHFVVMHDSMLSLMKLYNDVVSEFCNERVYFFPSPDNSFRSKEWLRLNFRAAWYKYNTSRAVVYDLRHNYAIENINNWTCEGFGFHDKLVSLSKSMGHRSVNGTKYYYSLVPGLSDIIEANSDDDIIIPEVNY